MNPAGLFLSVAGVWVLAQVLLGDAIGRLGIFGNKKSTSPVPGGGVGGSGSTPDVPAPAAPPGLHLAPTPNPGTA